MCLNVFDGYINIYIGGFPKRAYPETSETSKVEHILGFDPWFWGSPRLGNIHNNYLPPGRGCRPKVYHVTSSLGFV